MATFPDLAPDATTLVDRLLAVIEYEIVPLTRESVRHGNKIFGAAILRKEDLVTVIAGTNQETANPLWHGEIQTIKLLYELPRDQRHPPAKSLFLSTHEPCSLCLSAITWGGYDNFFYLFSHEDSRDAFQIPHDLRILSEVFLLEPGGYATENAYWRAFGIRDLIARCSPDRQPALRERVIRLEHIYAELSAIYQAHKGETEIPLN